VPLPEDLVNRALDAVGCADQQIGAITQGTRAAQVARRHYNPVREQLLRGAYWNFARKQAPMELLAARRGYAEGRPPGSIGTTVIPPWTYEYAWPLDAVAARFVPWNGRSAGDAGIPGNTNVPAVPPTTAGAPGAAPAGQIPARMLIASDDNYPPPSAAATPPDGWWNTRGLTLTTRKVVLTDVPAAELVYTVDQPYPNLWDPLFEAAYVALLATHLWLLNPDRQEARALRADQIAIARRALDTARVRDGDEGWPSVEHTPDWIRARRQGAGYGGLGGRGPDAGPGVWGYGWDAVGFGDGSVY
jgi:hypothetical protein